MLTFRDVTFGYTSQTMALAQVSFDLPQGSCTLLAGRNGSGKSTIVQLTNGLLRPHAGHIRLRGLSTADMPVHELVRDVAVMFQHPGDQITERTVAREVSVGIESLGLDRSMARIEAALQLVELSHRAGAHPYDLEPAERKLLVLAATVAMNTPIVVLDEPLVGLGPAEVRIVDRVVHQLRHEGRCVLFVAHDVVQAWSVADRVLVLKSGRVVHSGKVDQNTTPSSVFAAAGMEPPTTDRLAAALDSLPV